MPDKEKPQWMIYLQRAGYVAAALVSIGGLVYGVNGHYQSAEAAESSHVEIQVASDTAQYQANKDREKGDLRTQLQLIDLELKYEEDATEREKLLQQREIVLKRLQELQGADA